MFRISKYNRTTMIPKLPLNVEGQHKAVDSQTATGTKSNRRSLTNKYHSVLKLARAARAHASKHYDLLIKFDSNPLI